ncbi:MAG: hypothetical protein WDZ59_03515 [Pirellulales bacterium]
MPTRHFLPTARLLWSALVLLVLHAPHVQAQSQPLDFTRMVAHWADYADDGYLPFIEDAKPELVQLGFYGGHFWSLAHTPHGAGYPAHFPVQGHEACGQWFAQRNADLQKRGAKVIGHINVKFLVGDPESEDGPRGFFDFYANHWDEATLGSKPVDDPLSLLERDKNGKPISNSTYGIGGMREYWACLNNPQWREVLKRWVRVGIDRGLDGFIVNYFYRHDCHCPHCVEGFRRYLGERFSDSQLQELGIADLAQFRFVEIGSWHDPQQSTPLRREALRFSQIANKRAFDEVFIEYGRRLKPGLIVAQWNHLGDFSQISGDERCLLPANQWSAGEDYLWYSTGDAANATDLASGKLGEATLQARYVRGASGNKPYTLGKYEQVRIRAAIAELAANGGCPMGFYTSFGDPAAREVIVRYYQFLHAGARLYHRNESMAEVALLFPRSHVQAGDLKPLDQFKHIGRRLLDQHVLFDVVPDDIFADGDAAKYRLVIDPAEESSDIVDLPEGLSRFDAPATTRVSASRPHELDELTFHFVNYNRQEPPEGAQGTGIQDEKPVVTPRFPMDIALPRGRAVERVEFLTPEEKLPQVLPYQQGEGRLKMQVPPFLVYGVLRVHLDEATLPEPPPRKRIAAVVTEYRHNSHADIIVSRMLQTDTLDGRGKESPLELVSLYVDQQPDSDTSRMLAASHGFRLSDTIADALTLGTDKLAVDGVLLIAEHGDYPRSATGNIQYPKRRFWEEMLGVFRDSERVVPVFVDKHLSDNWADANIIYQTARELNVPLMAGSSLPVSWRRPAADVRPEAKLKEIVAITYHTTDAYGFHALEFSQALAEQRQGGETGIVEVQSLTDDAVWNAFERNQFDVELFDQAWNRLTHHGCRREELAQAVPHPKLLKVQYADGLRLHVLELTGAAGEWSAAWQYEDGVSESTLFWTQEGRPGMHFTYLLNGIEQMMLTGTPTWNVERTLLTSGALDALLTSELQGNRTRRTPQLNIQYRPSWQWQEPAYPPPTRPWSEQ